MRRFRTGSGPVRLRRSGGRRRPSACHLPSESHPLGGAYRRPARRHRDVAAQRMEQFMRISVIGCGYLGAVHAASMAELGHDVVGIDVDADKVEALSAGDGAVLRARLRGAARAHAGHRPAALHHRLRRRRAARRCTSSASAPRRSAASTPPTCATSRAPTESLLDVLAPGDLVVGKSTVPVGTAARLAELVADKVPGAMLAWNPEFLREGFAVAGHPAPRPAGLRPPRRRRTATPPARCSTRCTRTIVERGTPQVESPTTPPPRW